MAPLDVEWVLVGVLVEDQRLVKGSTYAVRHPPALTILTPVAVLVYVGHAFLMPPLQCLANVLPVGVLALHQVACHPRAEEVLDAGDGQALSLLDRTPR